MKPAKPTAPPLTLGECVVGDLVQTPAGWLLVRGEINGWPLVHLWEPGHGEVSQPFCARPSLQVLEVSRAPTGAPR